MKYLIPIKTFREVKEILNQYNASISNDDDWKEFYFVSMTDETKKIVEETIGLGWKIHKLNDPNPANVPRWNISQIRFPYLFFGNGSDWYYYDEAKEDERDDYILNWTAIQRWLCWWGRKLWKNNTHLDRSIPNSKHLLEEANELADAIEFYHLNKNSNENNIDNFNNVKKELADVCQLAYDIASDLGIDMNQAMIDKMEENKNREWHRPNKDGVIHHVKQIEQK